MNYILGYILYLLVSSSILLLLFYLFSKIKSMEKYNKNVKYGKECEKIVYHELKSNFNKNNLFKNVYLPFINSKSERYSEIDLLLITRGGIAVIEVKGRRGYIYNNPDSDTWLQYLGNKQYSFYNPFSQNATHIRALNNIFTEEKIKKIPIFNVVIFIADKVSFKYQNDALLSQEKIVPYIKKIDSKKSISQKDINSIKAVIKKYNKNSFAVAWKHKRDIRKRKKK